MDTFSEPETLPQFEDRVLYYLVELTGDRPLPLGTGIREGDLVGYLTEELGISPDDAQDSLFHSSDARGVFLAAIVQLEKEGLVEAQKVFGPWTIRPTRTGRLRVNQWHERWKKGQQAAPLSSPAQPPSPETQKAWREVARLRREIQLAQRNSSQPYIATESTLPIQVFFSYAHQDRDLRDELEKHLASLKQRRLIVGWHDRDITAGKERRQEIDANLTTAQIILLLVSPDFIHSDYCYGVEMEQAMARHEAKEAVVVPIILRPVDWEDTPFSRLQALPTEGRPITSWPNRDEAFFDVARGIRKIVNEMLVWGSVPPTNPPAPEPQSLPALPDDAPDFKILTAPLFQPNKDHWIDVNAVEQSLTIKNIGKENAYDICAVLFGCETYIVPQTLPQERMNGTDSLHWRVVSHCPVEPGATLVLPLQSRRDLLHGSQTVGNFPFSAPEEPSLGAIIHDPDLPFSSARLTLTYRDRSQKRYMQVFDYQHPQKTWAYLSHPTPISVDLLDLLRKEK